MPPAIRAEVGLPPLAEALRAVHRPGVAVQAEAGRRRLAFDELLDLQLMLIRARTVAKRQRSRRRLHVCGATSPPGSRRPFPGSSPRTSNARSARSPAT